MMCLVHQRGCNSSVAEIIKEAADWHADDVLALPRKLHTSQALAFTRQLHPWSASVTKEAAAC
jgi:negative regulator of sigma E activity